MNIHHANQYGGRKEIETYGEGAGTPVLPAWYSSAQSGKLMITGVSAQMKKQIEEPSQIRKNHRPPCLERNDKAVRCPLGCYMPSTKIIPHPAKTQKTVNLK